LVLAIVASSQASKIRIPKEKLTKMEGKKKLQLGPPNLPLIEGFVLRTLRTITEDSTLSHNLA